MIILAIDTSTVRGAVALLRDDKPLGEESFDRSRAGQNLFDAAARLLSAHGLGPADPGLLAVGLGPGSFTGIRAGIAAAKGLALPRHVPIKGASSYDALALTALPKMPQDCPQMCVLGDARRDEIYYALYDREGRRVKDCRIATLEALADEIHQPIWFVSSEIERYKDDLVTLMGGFASIEAAPMYPRAAAVSRLAFHRFRDDNNRGDESMEPIYLRALQYKVVGT
ncbi:MAG TPA: tRNA (adenosine(37)-N6)-threonylcarbamoyltransferase complex dimerization subunit type 1 TsaB [Verrucomicrobiae bacterium]|nr:tRNA (adenosine(37)-N6)-threonylcarbamoyltransferase complex dimerization subunit type 1 TsaB [Verrucomicrobiae bacterium]